MSSGKPLALEVIILAAGRGTRMQSQLPKVLHLLAGKPLLAHVLDSVRTLKPKQIHVVCGFGSAQIREYFAASDDINWVHQKEQKGTAHAVQVALPDVTPDSNVLVMYGDVPLAGVSTLKSCVAYREDDPTPMRLVTSIPATPFGLGRIIRDANDNICEIVEESDASESQKAVSEINTGIYFVSAKKLHQFLAGLTPHNAQGELYLTDIVAAAVQQGIQIECVVAENAEEFMGINDRIELARSERYFQYRCALNLLKAGVALSDPARIDVRGQLSVGEDCFIDCNVVFEGEVVLGNGVTIEPGVVIRNSHIGDGVTIQANTVIEGARIANECNIGPFARIRPGTELADKVKIGNFVETKNVRLGANTKASHLAYLGDARVGADSNIGAGTIFCNYDGLNKHQTNIGDGVFVGSNSTLVAPITIEDNAFLAAGSTLNKDVGENELAVGRGKQRNIKGWSPPAKQKVKEK